MTDARVAALTEALWTVALRHAALVCDCGSGRNCIRLQDIMPDLFPAAAILAALPPEFCLDPAHGQWEASLAPLVAEIARLRSAIKEVVDDAESQHPGGWGPDVTTVGILRAALGEEGR